MKKILTIGKIVRGNIITMTCDKNGNNWSCELQERNGDITTYGQLSTREEARIIFDKIVADVE